MSQSPVLCGRSLKMRSKVSIDFGVKPFKKGLVGVERATPSKALRLHGKPIFANFSQLKIVPILVVLRSKTQNIIPKGKSVLFGSALRRSPLLQGFPAPYFGAHCV